jgi:hypothetical protein
MGSAIFFGSPRRPRYRPRIIKTLESLADPLMRGHFPGECQYRHMRVPLQCEKISDGAHDQAVHHESGSEGSEFGREGVHVGLLK